MQAAEFNDSSESYEATPKENAVVSFSVFFYKTIIVEVLIKIYRENTGKVSAVFRLKPEIR